MHQKVRASKLSPGLALHLLNPFARNWFGEPLSYYAAWFNHSQVILWSVKQSKSLSVSQPPSSYSLKSSHLFFIVMTIVIQDL